MSRLTRVLSPDEVKFLIVPDSTEMDDETFTENINESKCEDQDEDVNFQDEEVEEEEKDVADEDQEDIVDEEEDVDDEEEAVEEKPMPVDTKLKQMSHENINELISKIHLVKSEGDEENDSFEDTDPNNSSSFCQWIN